MNVLVFSTQRLASYLSSRVLSSILLPYTPPWALTESKYALVPMFIWIPNWAAGPEKAADWPSRIDLAVTPGVCAMLLNGATQASREAIKNLIFTAVLLSFWPSARGLRRAADFDYCGRPVEPNFSRLPSAIGVSVAATLLTLGAATFCVGALARATTKGFILAVSFGCGSAAKTEEEIRKQPARAIAARMIKSPMLSIR